MFFAERTKSQQTGFLRFSKSEAQTLAKIEGAKLGREFCLRGDDLSQPGEICIALCAQLLGD